MTDLGPVADRLEIIEVCTRAHWCYDHQDWNGLDLLFADAVSTPTLAQAASPGFDLDGYLDGYLFSREELKRALSSVQAGLITQHLIAGHQVTLEGDTAVCLAHSVNIHLASPLASRLTSRLPSGVASVAAASDSGHGLVAHGNDYRFDLLRTADGWRIRGWVPRIRWGYGDEASYDADARQAAWRQSLGTELLSWADPLRPTPARGGPLAPISSRSRTGPASGSGSRRRRRPRAPGL